jgi:hypothetical protein
LVDDADFQEIEFVGHYRIISLLGEGGRVYHPYRRERCLTVLGSTPRLRQFSISTLAEIDASYGGNSVARIQSN